MYMEVSHDTFTVSSARNEHRLTSLLLLDSGGTQGAWAGGDEAVGAAFAFVPDADSKRVLE